jgi:hypothetical protein
MHGIYSSNEVILVRLLSGLEIPKLRNILHHLSPPAGFLVRCSLVSRRLSIQEDTRALLLSSTSKLIIRRSSGLLWHILDY